MQRQPARCSLAHSGTGTQGGGGWLGLGVTWAAGSSLLCHSNYVLLLSLSLIRRCQLLPLRAAALVKPPTPQLLPSTWMLLRLGSHQSSADPPLAPQSHTAH